MKCHLLSATLLAAAIVFYLGGFAGATPSLAAGSQVRRGMSTTCSSKPR